jgi:two-component system sensor histidine kinase TctE
MTGGWRPGFVLPRRGEPSLFTRLVGLIALVLAVGAGVLMGAAWLYARAAADEAYDRLLLGAAFQITESIGVQDGALAPDLPTAAFEMLALSERDRIFYRIIGTRGETVTGYPDLEAPGDLPRPGAKPAIANARYGGEPVRVAAVGRRISDGDVSGVVHVLVAQTVLARQELARELTLRALALVLAMSALALGGVVFAVRTALAPLKSLAAELRQRDPNDLTPLSAATPRELQPFVSAINYFMGRLSERIAVLKHFIADAAHQIRTPITAIISQLELLASVEMSPKGEEHLARTQARAAELARLTNQLLSHAMVIHRTGAVAFEPVDLADVAREALRNAVPVSLDRAVTLSLDAPKREIVIPGERLSLREALTNVIDNALRHGAPSRLAVRVREDGEAVQIEVEDDGPGMSRERQEEVVHRFGRPASGERTGGLGFAIAAEVCRAHRGTLSFRGGSGDPFVVVLRFPKPAGGFAVLADLAEGASQQPAVPTDGRTP